MLTTNIKANQKTGNNMDLKMIPAREYALLNDISLDELKVGDVVPISITNYDYLNKEISCAISNTVRNCFIRESNFDFPQSLKKISKISGIPTVISSRYRNVIARIIAINSDGTIELDRKSVLEETEKTLIDKMGSVIWATVENVLSYGIFIDIGNGLISFIHITELSTSRYSNAEFFFRNGDKVKCRLLSYDEELRQFHISRKEAYNREVPDSHSFCEVIVCARANEEGFFVEYNPHTAGIMDVCGNISFIPGTHVLVEIKNDTEKGFRSRFLARI